MLANFACCCKAMLPALYMGRVTVRLDAGRSMLQVSRCLRKQPGGITHLDLYTDKQMLGIRNLIKLRCIHACQL